MPGWPGWLGRPGALVLGGPAGLAGGPGWLAGWLDWLAWLAGLMTELAWLDERNAESPARSTL